MLDYESRALSKIDELAIGSSKPKVQIMGFEDNFFLFDNPSQLSFGMGGEELLLPDPGGSLEVPEG